MKLKHKKSMLIGILILIIIAIILSCTFKNNEIIDYKDLILIAST